MAGAGPVWHLNADAPQDDTSFCAVHGRRADTKAVKELSINLVANSGVQARLGVEVKQVTREQQTEANGLVETIVY